MYWAEERAAQTAGPARAAKFAPLAATLAEQEDTINAELIGVHGSPADTGGYYQPDDDKASAVMRPSATLNAAIASL